MSSFEDLTKKADQNFQDAQNNETTTNYWNLSTTLGDLEGALREHIQAVTKDKVQSVIDRLKSGGQLTGDDLRFVKLWIVGDADHYVKLENNYKDWTKELKRLLHNIRKHNTKDMDFETASQLRAYVLDAIRVLGDIVFFIKQKDRVKNFEESTYELDQQERDLLIRLLEGKMLSPFE